MTFNELVKQLCEDEGLKVQVSRGNMREILSKLSRRMALSEEVEKCLLKNGNRILHREMQKGKVRP